MTVTLNENPNCETVKKKLQAVMSEVVSSGKDAFIKIPGGKILHLAFEMLNLNDTVVPICNVFLLDDNGNVASVVYERIQEDDKVISTGSLEAVFGLCRE
jgi:hypothetical protein